MNLLVNLMRCRAAAVLALALLASCGGSNRVEPFTPSRLLVFGDENSVIDDTGRTGNGRIFSVNGLNADSTPNCGVRLIWVQYLASQFGLVQSQCNTGGVANPPSRIYAQAGSRVAAVQTQVDAHLVSDSFQSTDLVTIMSGANDIFDQYALYPGVPEDQLKVNVAAAGAALAVQVNRIANAGGKVIVSTVVDLGLTPFALVQSDGGAVATRLTAAFNEQLRAGIINNGRLIGLVVADEIVQTMARFPANYSLADVTTVVCDKTKAATVDLCTSSTLITNGNADTWLWADDKHLATVAHRNIGAAAVARAVNNPF
jgi:outer membrane lipase/esterase